MATPSDVLKMLSGRGGRHRRHPVLRPAGADAALLDPRARAERGRLRGRPRLRRLVDPRVPGDPGVGHAPDPRPRHRGDRPVHAAQDAQHQLLRAGPGHRRVLQPRPALHREEGRGLPPRHRHRRHRVLRARGRVLHLRLGALRPEPVLGLLLPRLDRGRVELGARAGARRLRRTSGTRSATRRGTSPSRRWTSTRISARRC